jgi:hypothetical protein
MDLYFLPGFEFGFGFEIINGLGFEFYICLGVDWILDFTFYLDLDLDLDFNYKWIRIQIQESESTQLKRWLSYCIWIFEIWLDSRSSSSSSSRRNFGNLGPVVLRRTRQAGPIRLPL